MKERLYDPGNPPVSFCPIGQSNAINTRFSNALPLHPAQNNAMVFISVITEGCVATTCGD